MIPKIHLNVVNIVTALIVPVIFTACYFWAIITPGNDLSNLIAGGGVVATVWIMVGYYFLDTYAYWKHLVRFITPTCNIAVGWTYTGYAVKCDEVDLEIQRVLKAFEPKYGKLQPRAALEKCVVEFVAPLFGEDGRWVRGIQDATYCKVGWALHAADSALAHELGHRVLQVLVPGLDEKQEHELLSKIGL